MTPGANPSDFKREKKENQLVFEPFSRYKEAILDVIARHFKYGFRHESTIELGKFKRFAKEDSVEIPDFDADLKNAICEAAE